MSKSADSAGYQRLAKYYDDIYKGIVDYDAQADKIISILKSHSRVKVKSILDLACGTGNYSFVFARKGYKVVGIDISEQMVDAAMRKARQFSSEKPQPHFLKEDISNLGNIGKHDAALVLFGGFGYLLGQRKVEGFFSSVKRNLVDDGLLVFEFWQKSAVRDDSRSKNGFRTWVKAETPQNTLIRLDTSKFDPNTEIIQINFECYALNKRKTKIVDSFTEVHNLKTYSIGQMKKIIRELGFTPLAFYSGEMRSKLKHADEETFRVLAVSRKAS